LFDPKSYILEIKQHCAAGIPKGLEESIKCWKRAFGWKLALRAGTVGIPWGLEERMYQIPKHLNS